MGDREVTGHCPICKTMCIDGDPHCDCWLPPFIEDEPEPREEEETR